jgi:hypothetical protein
VTTILDTVRHRTRVLSRRLQRQCSRIAATSPDDASTRPPEGGRVKYHPILLMIDEDRLARTTKSAALAHAGIDAVRDYALWLGDRVAASGIRSCAAEAQRLARIARRYGIRGSALDILADPAEPAVARERALGLVITEIFQLRDEPAASDAA